MQTISGNSRALRRIVYLIQPVIRRDIGLNSAARQQFLLHRIQAQPAARFIHQQQLVGGQQRFEQLPVGDFLRDEFFNLLAPLEFSGLIQFALPAAGFRRRRYTPTVAMTIRPAQATPANIACRALTTAPPS